MRVILFDFDGVLVDTFAFCYRIIHSRDALSVEDYRARFESNVNDSLKKILQPPPGAKPFDFFGQYTPELLRSELYPGMADLVRSLASTHELIIVSSTISPPINAFLVQRGLRDCFQDILGNDVDKSKVKKIQMVLERYSLAPSDTVFVTDTLGDIREASVCGVPSIAVTWGYHQKETLTRGSPYRTVVTPSELLRELEALDTTSTLPQLHRSQEV